MLTTKDSIKLHANSPALTSYVTAIALTCKEPGTTSTTFRNFSSLYSILAMFTNSFKRIELVFQHGPFVVELFKARLAYIFFKSKMAAWNDKGLSNIHE